MCSWSRCVHHVAMLHEDLIAELDRLGCVFSEVYLGSGTGADNLLHARGNVRHAQSVCGAPHRPSQNIAATVKCQSCDWSKAMIEYGEFSGLVSDLSVHRDRVTAQLEETVSAASLRAWKRYSHALSGMDLPLDDTLVTQSAAAAGEHFLNSSMQEDMFKKMFKRALSPHLEAFGVLEEEGAISAKAARRLRRTFSESFLSEKPYALVSNSVVSELYAGSGFYSLLALLSPAWRISDSLHLLPAVVHAYLDMDRDGDSCDEVLYVEELPGDVVELVAGLYDDSSYQSGSDEDPPDLAQVLAAARTLAEQGTPDLHCF